MCRCSALPLSQHFNCQLPRTAASCSARLRRSWSRCPAISQSYPQTWRRCQNQSMKTVLFLDIDGICHPEGASRISALGKVEGEGLFRWAPQLMALLNELPHVQVVVHSSWRQLFETDDEVRALMPGELAARVVACTPREVLGRHESILAYIERESVEGYVIVDDDGRWFPRELPQLVLCSPKTGLSSKAKVQALRVALLAVEAAAIEFDPPKAVIVGKPVDLS